MPILDKIKEVFQSDKDKSSSSSKTAPTPAQTDATTNTATTQHSGHTATPPAAATTATSTTSGSATTTAADLSSSGPAFDAAKVKVIYVLGGPGAGKGTQCERLVRDYGFKHLSGESELRRDGLCLKTIHGSFEKNPLIGAAGDLLRAEQNREGSEFGAMIKSYITDGKIVPMEVTVKLLENAMKDTLKSPPTFSTGSSGGEEWAGGKGRFLIDGFPRKMDQALKFDESVCKSAFVLFISTTEEVMLDRLLERGKTSGRDDDNRESITKRFSEHELDLPAPAQTDGVGTFIDTSMPVVDYYRERGLVEEIDSSPSPDEVYAVVRKAMDKRLGPSSTANASASVPAAQHSSSAATTTAQTGSLPPLTGGQVAPVLGAPL